ncbi:(Fe-S)-binding protein [Geobacter sp. FeAm09]|uniref:(Fe-S)-binding protein n=1 Tax=Geobacter sp. FeAm09 TaxID=2597769 RepID=UPI001F115A1D|nr:(Fe-S)-binding protein [Geobacter sp. FeAm09]
MDDARLADIRNNCTECGLCADSCHILTESGESPAAMAARGATLHEALSCSFCGACEAVCPQGVAPLELFAAKRREAVENGEFAVEEFRYLYPDRERNLMSMYRAQCGIDYQDLEASGEATSCFFPGCSLMTYSPGLTREVFGRLKESGVCQAIWTACCGKVLDQLGLRQRLQNMQEHLRSFVREHGIKRLVVACPGCYHDLGEILRGSGVAIQTVYEVLDFGPGERAGGRRCTVHDACPDRTAGLFGGQVRTLLEQSGFAITEMSHTRANTICCGSGGQLSHFRPDLVDELVERRRDEFQQTGADVLVGYCLSCVLKYDSMLPGVPVTHALNLLLEREPDYRGVKERARRMFEGPDGEKLWEEVMAD